MRTEWKRKLRREASAHGMCESKRVALEGNLSDDEAVDLYIDSIEWALSENYPPIEDIREQMPKEVLENHGIFVDREFHGEILNDRQFYVFHHCSGTIKTGLNLNLRLIPMFYFANGCDMKIEPYGQQSISVSIPLFVFGENQVESAPSEGLVCRTRKREVKNGSR